VALHNARHDRTSIRFNLINPDTGNRIRMITQDAETGDELERRNLVKGYEFRKNQYLILSNEDLDSVKVESSSVMTVEKFADADSIRRCRPRCLCRPSRSDRQDRQGGAVARRHCPEGAHNCPASRGRRAHGAYAL